MKKTIITFIAAIFYCLVGYAQPGVWKKFSILNIRNSPQSPLQSATATIQKTSTIIIPEVQLGNPVAQPSIKSKTISPTDKPTLKREVSKDYSIFVIPGTSSSVSTTSIQAKFGFESNAYDTSYIELYKVELKDGNRIFSVIAGTTTALKIPISFITKTVGGAATTATSSGVNQIIISNYLTAGEYVFIDKTSISTDGTQINCYAFKIL